MSNLLSQLLSEAKDTEKSQVEDSDMNSEDETLDEEIALNRMATAFNILSEEHSEMDLSEAVSIVRLNKQAKTSALAARTALLLAKQKGDVLYQKYAKHNGLRLQLRSQIFKKYGAKANQRARALMQGVAKPIKAA